MKSQLEGILGKNVVVEPGIPNKGLAVTISRVSKSVVDDFTMVVTQANEVLSEKKVHGKIGSVGVGFGTGRHTANIFHRQKNSGSSAVVRDDEYRIRIKSAEPRLLPEKHSVAIGLSADCFQSIRSKGEQVSEGRFEPPIFDANCQTTNDLLKFLQPPSNQAMTCTEPVKFHLEVPRRVFMVQTDPIIYEPEGVSELSCLLLPNQHSSTLQILEAPSNP